MKLLAAITLVLLLAAPTIACSNAGAWQDAIARAVARTDAAQSYRATLDTTQDIEGCTTQSSLVMEYSGGDSHSRSNVTSNCPSDSPGEATGSSGDLTLVFWSETIVADDRAFISRSDWPEWRECELTTGSPSPIAGERSGPPTPTTPHPTPTHPPAPPSPLFTPPPQPPAANQTPQALPRVHITSSLMTGGSSRTTAPDPTPRATSTGTCAVARVSSGDSLDRLINVEKLPDEAVDGVPCSHYRGNVDRDSYVDALIETYEREGVISELGPLFLKNLELMRRQEIVVEIWIDGEDYMRQVRTDARIPRPDPDTGEEVWGTGVTIERYFDFNEPIVIEPPDLAAQ